MLMYACPMSCIVFLYGDSGANFGPKSPRVFIGNDECANLQWTNHSYVTCTLPPGTGTSRSVILLQLNGGISSSQLTLSYVACSSGTEPSGYQCVECPLGWYSPLGIKCSQCSAGTYANITGLKQCYSTPEGSSQSAQNASSYDVCVNGTYAPQQGLTSCIACSKGSWTYGKCSFIIAAAPIHNHVVIMSSLLLPCHQIGDDGDLSSKISCTKCPRGTYSDGFRSCTLCEGLNYALTEGQAACSTCQGAVYIIRQVSPIPGYDNITCAPCPSV
jgi:hypothetical protein